MTGFELQNSGLRTNNLPTEPQPIAKVKFFISTNGGHFLLIYVFSRIDSEYRDCTTGFEMLSFGVGSDHSTN